MAERVKLDPTIDEIVVALRETTQGAGRARQFTVVGRQPGGNQAPDGTLPGGKPSAGWSRGSEQRIGSIDIADLRDGEIERLLIENARHNERVVFLLKVIEREQARNAELEAERAAVETDRGAVVRDVRAALETELRPVLLLVLGLLKKPRVEPAEDGPGRSEPDAACLVAKLSGFAADLAPVSAFKAVAPTTAVPRVKLRQRASRVLAALRC